jgi:hypothetical protein
VYRISFVLSVIVTIRLLEKTPPSGAMAGAGISVAFASAPATSPVAALARRDNPSANTICSNIWIPIFNSAFDAHHQRFIEKTFSQLPHRPMMLENQTHPAKQKRKQEPCTRETNSAVKSEKHSVKKIGLLPVRSTGFRITHLRAARWNPLVVRSLAPPSDPPDLKEDCSLAWP